VEKLLGLRSIDKLTSTEFEYLHFHYYATEVKRGIDWLYSCQPVAIKFYNFWLLLLRGRFSKIALVTISDFLRQRSTSSTHSQPR